MKSRLYLMTALCSAALATTTGASAANSAISQSLAPVITVASSTVTASSEKATDAQRATNVQKASDVQVEKLIGETVENFDGENVGDIESVIVGESGEVRAVVVGVGGFLGIGERLVAIDWSELDISENGDTVRIAATADQLKAMPAYTYEAEERRGTIYQDRRFVSRSADDDTADADDDSDKEEMELKESVSTDTLFDRQGNVKASKLIGIDVVDAQGEVVGDIEEILFSDDGKVFAVLGAGGILGMGETQLLVQWDQLEVRTRDDQAQIRTLLTQDDLRKLPSNRN